MGNVTTSTTVDNFMQATDAAAARTVLDTPAATTTISAGTGLTGGGDLSANRTLSVSSDVVVRDASQNITANSIIEGFSTISASGTQVTLTVASVPSYLVTGSGGQVIQLPNATTLQNGVVYLFNNNQSSGAITVNNNSGTLVASIPSGGFTVVSLLSNATAAGYWERHEQAPSNVTWSTNTLDYAGSITSATWNGVAVAINRGGTGATTTQAAISNLGIGMRMVEAQTNGSITGTMVGNVFTVTTPGVFTTDGYTPVLGDIIAFALQGGGTSTQNGFWEVTTVGTASVSAVFTRPSWFTGTARNGMYMTRFGASQGGYVMAFFGPGGSADITVGTTAIQVVRVNSRIANATTAVNLFTAYQTFRANGTGANSAPFFFQAGAALMSAAQAHAVEWFNDQMYLTTAAGVRTTNTTHVAIPATATSTGQVGQIAVDNAGSWLYVCTAANVWKRTALTTF
jgi:hypothetical protein